MGGWLGSHIWENFPKKSFFFWRAFLTNAKSYDLSNFDWCKWCTIVPTKFWKGDNVKFWLCTFITPPLYERNKEKKKNQYIDNKDHILEKARDRYQNNKYEIQHKKKETYNANKEAILEKRKEHYAKNKEEIKQKKNEYYDNNRESILENKRERYASKQNKTS